MTTGGIAGNYEIVSTALAELDGSAPKSMITTSARRRRRRLDIAAESGVRLVNRDRMATSIEGVQNWDPIWPGHAIRILPDRRRCGSTLWASGSCSRICRGTTHSARCVTCDTPEISGYDHSWFILTQKIIEREFALSGSEQNPDITSKDRGPF
ncbi:MAG: FAD-binding protein [Mycobacterium sp.]